MPCRPSTDELARMRGRGWLTNYSIGNTTPAAGLPIANALRWDTGLQVRWQRDPVTVYGAVTQGTIGDPRLSDDNGGPQLAARRRVHAAPRDRRWAGRSRPAPTWSRDLTPRAAWTAGHPQPPAGGLRGRRRGVARPLAGARRAAYGTDGDSPRTRATRSGDLDAMASMVEARVQAVAGTLRGRPHRAPRLLGTSPRPRRASSTWDADVTRLELGGGWPSIATCC